MIEIATCMNDLAEGAVWGHKTQRGRVVRLRSVWVGANKVKGVGFDIWDYELKGLAWETNATMDAEKFRDEYVYLEHHTLNAGREAEKNAYMTERAISRISDCFAVEQRAEGLGLLKTLQTLMRRQAGYEITSHEWDEGCVGVGCCADTAEMAGDMLLDNHTLTADEIKDLLA